MNIIIQNYKNESFVSVVELFWIPFCCSLKGTGFLFLLSFTIGFYSFLNKFAISDYLGEYKEEEGGERETKREQLLNISFPFLPSFWLSNHHFWSCPAQKIFPLPCYLHLEGFLFFSFLYFFFSAFLFFSYLIFLTFLPLFLPFLKIQE